MEKYFANFAKKVSGKRKEMKYKINHDLKSR